MNKTKVHVIILLVEGATEVEFYTKIRSILLNRYPKTDKYQFLPPINVKGIGNFKIRASRQFDHAVQKFEADRKKDSKQKTKKKDVKIKYQYHAFMCIDTDVLDSSARTAKFSQKPPINEDDKKQRIQEKNGTPHFIKAEYSIEDWFLEDKKGIMEFLQNPKLPKFSTNQSGAEKLKAIFKAGNKVYTKGTSCKGFIDCLNIDMILTNHKNEFEELIDILK